MAKFLVVYARKPKHTMRTIYNGAFALQILAKFNVDDLRKLRETGRCIVTATHKIPLTNHKYIPAGMELHAQTNAYDDVDKLIETAEKKQEKNDKSEKKSSDKTGKSETEKEEK